MLNGNKNTIYYMICYGGFLFVLIFEERNIIQNSTGHSDKETFIYPENIFGADIMEHTSANHELYVIPL